MKNVDCGMRNAECIHENGSKYSNLKSRTKKFALDIIELVGELPTYGSAVIISKQLVRSATSIGANYRSACRAKSRRDFVSKMCIVEEEADESMYWLELLIEAKIASNSKVTVLLQEANELISIVVASIRTAKNKE